MSTERDQLIRARAYAIWEAEGSPSGRELDHWQQAAREVDEARAEVASGAEQPTAKTRAPGRRGKAAGAADLTESTGAPATKAPSRGRPRKSPEAAATAEVSPASEAPVAAGVAPVPARRGRKPKAAEAAAAQSEGGLFGDGTSAIAAEVGSDSTAADAPATKARGRRKKSE